MASWFRSSELVLRRVKVHLVPRIVVSWSCFEVGNGFCVNLDCFFGRFPGVCLRYFDECTVYGMSSSSSSAFALHFCVNPVVSVHIVTPVQIFCVNPVVSVHIVKWNLDIIINY